MLTQELQVLLAFGFVVIFAAHLWAIILKNQTGRDPTISVKHLTKTLLVPLIILFFIISAPERNWLIVTALFLGFLGDVLLIMEEKSIKGVFLKAGLAAFLMGHIVYIIVFLQSTSFLKIVPGWFYLCAIPYIVYGAFMYTKLKNSANPLLFKSMKLPVIIYMVVILTMSFSSLCLVWRGVDRLFWFPFLGSLFFVASDSLQVYKRFIKSKTPKQKPSEQENDVWYVEKYDLPIMITYILAQLFITLGFIV
ncbi:MAG TPA: lysoplasmalogenase [Bacillota bacterium]|nr:lysoplasmalogenase [Bacillota bacterium]